MSPFSYQDGVLGAESVPLTTIADAVGTPCFVYSRAALTDAFNAYARAFADTQPLVCYAAKANSNIAILDLFARLGSGFDIVSGGELARVLAAGGSPDRVVFSGVGKSEAEMRFALEHGILCFNVESSSELERLNRVAGRDQARSRRYPSASIPMSTPARTHTSRPDSRKTSSGYRTVMPSRSTFARSACQTFASSASTAT